VVREYATKARIDKLAPHDLRRTCARLCYAAGGKLEQIQFLLGHISIQTTERYLGCKQRIQGAVNDKIGIEPPGLSEGSLSALPTIRQSESSTPSQSVSVSHYSSEVDWTP
jgi:hypothetical protein